MVEGAVNVLVADLEPKSTLLFPGMASSRKLSPAAGLEPADPDQ